MFILVRMLLPPAAFVIDAVPPVEGNMNSVWPVTVPSKDGTFLFQIWVAAARSWVLRLSPAPTYATPCNGN
jgi:hypothetical protein